MSNLTQLRLVYRKEGIQTMRGWRVAPKLSEQMVDAAMEGIEKADSKLAEIGSVHVSEQNIAIIRQKAIDAAKAVGSGIIAWIALQIFLRYVLPKLIEWWIDRRTLHEVIQCKRGDVVLTAYKHPQTGKIEVEFTEGIVEFDEAEFNALFEVTDRDGVA